MEINTIVVIKVLKKFSAKLTTERVSSLLRLSDATAKRLVYGYPKGEPHWVDEANWVATKDKTEDDIEDDIEVKDSFSKQFVWAFMYCFQKYLMSDLQVAKQNIIAQLMKQNVPVNDTTQITSMSDFRSIAEYLVNSACANYVKRRVDGDDSVLVVQEAQAQIPIISPAETQPTFRFGGASVSSIPKAFLDAYLQKLPTLPQKSAGFISDLMYDTCPAAFLGRDNELARLYSFACDERPLLWWAITGSAGRGKTRLAHEFLKQLNSDEQWLARTVNWRAFVSDFSETGMYLPQGPVKLFIVIDYVFAYEESIANWIEWLSSHLSDGHRIRILLIERDDQKIDPSGQTMRAPWEELFGAVPQDPMLMIRLKYSRENLNLNEAIISSKDAEAIVRSYCANKNISLAPHQIDKIHFCVMTFLDRDNNFNPLQLLLLTEYFIKNEHQGTSSTNIFHSALESIVAKERITLQRLFNIEFCEQDAFDCVLLFATIVGSINLRSELFQELVLCDRSTLKNVLTKMEVSRKCERGKDGAYYLRGIQPDMIGEHFVHTFFSAQSDEQLCRILYSIHTRNRYELSRFLLRYVQDFKKEIIAQGRLNIFSGYLPDKNTSFIVHDSVGNEVICDILFTFDSEENGKSYIVYTDNTRDAGGKTQVYASIYDPATANSQLWPIQTEKEWGIIEIILSELQNSIQEYGADIDSDALTELIDERIHATFGDA